MVAEGPTFHSDSLCSADRVSVRVLVSPWRRIWAERPAREEEPFRRRNVPLKGKRACRENVDSSGGNRTGLPNELPVVFQILHDHVDALRLFGEIRGGLVNRVDQKRILEFRVELLKNRIHLRDVAFHRFQQRLTLLIVFVTNLSEEIL